ncbi:MAG: monooxygenase [Deltaproteobacteria bacterium]|nr:MAG: monooxygenase [Deltaproteobacteria bacterium]
MTDRICIIGAGPSGITAARNLRAAGLTDITVLDRGHAVGGNWVFDADSGHSSVFETTHIISSKRFSQYEEFPLPDDAPDYPDHQTLARYFQDYARHFDLERHIRFGRLVTRCTLRDDGRWTVASRPDADPDAEEETETFDRLVVANGHHWKPRWPSWPGAFDGELLHSHHYKRAEPFRDQRVLIVGGGNSACDCAVETARVSARTDLSWRRGYWIVPKFMFGQPGDVLYNRVVQRASWVPLTLRYRAMERMLRLVNGPNRLYGLPEPDHRFGETHPTVNSELLYFLRHGAIHPRPDIARLDGHDVHFTDGTTGTYDAIIACTGYEISHPFLDPELIDYSTGPVPLYRKMIHPTLDSIAFVGLFQPIGCIWPLAELQSRLLARWWTGRWSPPADRETAIRDELANPHLRQLDSPRHTITVDYPTFRRELLDELGRA